MAVVLSGSMSGCSFLFVNPAPPPEDWSPIVRCTSSDALPIVDALVTGLQVLRTALVVSASDAEYAHSAIPREVDITIGVGLSALFLSSSLVGFRTTSKCREVLANREDPDRAPPRTRRPPPHLIVGPPPLSQQKREEVGADAGSPSEVDAGTALPAVAPDKTPERGPPAVRQRRDPE